MVKRKVHVLMLSYIIKEDKTFLYVYQRLPSPSVIMRCSPNRKALETEFLISICRPNGDKWQSNTLFLAICDPCSSIVKSIFNCGLSDMI